MLLFELKTTSAKLQRSKFKANKASYNAQSSKQEIFALKKVFLRSTANGR